MAWDNSCDPDEYDPREDPMQFGVRIEDIAEEVDYDEREQ